VVLTVPSPHCGGRRRVPLHAPHDGLDGPPVGQADVAVDQLVEIGLPRAALPVGPGEAAELVVSVQREVTLMDRWPGHGTFEFPLPAEEAWLRAWLV
jgi:hypothetical protein